ncbi:uncharacterized protein BJ171DRAFT_615809 [Polychytrium aggregatum]|uniref:uncharacterized protein n=1 Tax=Polychytrium aggregatum TaxID=110093 RepID=UPI0022FEDF0B|nr:uncharacterized protein BJ171DRAFT_615809 [Polychytrium aggregatum]KAI9205248.1 hypothetical protein BJ171DRAFT_615809 [Polychytrium aggregatum]
MTLIPIVDSKAPRVLKLQLMPKGPQVHALDYDKRMMDLSDSHRSEMRKKLYGDDRDNRTMPYSYLEAGTHQLCYADEKPPPWKSTMQGDYITKRLDRTELHRVNAENSEISAFIKASHFKIEGPESTSETPISTTRRDFATKSMQSVGKHDPKRLMESYQAFPPIYRDEHLETTRSQYQESFSSRSGIKDVSVVHAKVPTGTHISLGGDSPDWESVTSRAYHQSPKLGRVDRVLVKKVEAKSSVLDNPDGEVDPNLDRSKLMVDTKGFISEIKATHFTLGNSTDNQPRSQYQASFIQHGVDSVPATQRFRYIPSNVHFEEEETTPFKSTSSHHIDFQQKKLKSSGIIVEGNGRAQETKHSDGHTSVSLGTDSNEPATSVTTLSYPSPNSRDPEVYRNRSTFRFRSQYNPISNEPDDQSRQQSLTRSNFLPFDQRAVRSIGRAAGHVAGVHDYSQGHSDPHPAGSGDGELNLLHDYRQVNEAGNATKAFLRGHHFELGSGASPGTGPTSHSEHFQNVKPTDKAEPVPLDYSYETTLQNTVTRYPMDSATFESVSQKTYGNFPFAPDPALPVPAKPDTIQEYISTFPTASHLPKRPRPASTSRSAPAAGAESAGLSAYHEQARGSVAGSAPAVFKPDMSTVTRRSFVPPEVMVYKQPTDIHLDFDLKRQWEKQYPEAAAALRERHRRTAESAAVASA